MVYTLFFSRRRQLPSEEEREYLERSETLRSRAEDEHPGFIDMKSYIAEDGERLTVARFRDDDAQRAWRLDEGHREAQERGRSRYYESYRVLICEPIREHSWVRSEASEL